jgi:hypothetical protein
VSSDNSIPPTHIIFIICCPPLTAQRITEPLARPPYSPRLQQNDTMLRPRLTISTIVSLLLLHTIPAHAFSCSISTSSLKYDINPLSGLRSTEKSTSTPPTTNDAKAVFDLCSENGIPHDDDLSDEDQVSAAIQSFCS